MGNKPRGRKTTKKTATKTRAPVQEKKSTPPWVSYVLWGAGAIALIVLLTLAFGGLQSSNVDAPEGVQRFTNLDRTHAEGAISYEQDPPVGGAHAPVWLNCGYFSDPVPNETVVHSLEHGIVWIAYDPALDEDSIDELRGYAGEPQVIVSPYPGLDAAVSLQTWGNQLKLNDVNDERLDQFVRALKDGPDTPEPGAGCAGGIGVPG